MRPVEGVFKVILLLFVQLNLQQFVFFRLMYERWPYECPTVLTAAMIRGRNRPLDHHMPGWSVPRSVESWFDRFPGSIHPRRPRGSSRDDAIFLEESLL